MIRRNFLYIAILTVLGVGSMGTFFLNSSFFSKLYYKLQSRINPPSGPKPENERSNAILPEDGPTISVETALNSRCTSDYDDIPQNFHWGMFDKTKKLTSDQITQIKNFAKIPRFTDAHTEIRNERNILMFIIDNRVFKPMRNWLMIENGMQQQAIGLVCSALGVGMVFSALADHRVAFSENDYATIRIELDPMKPTYDGSYWSKQSPPGPKPWLKGNLPDPARSGQKPLLDTLANLETRHDGRNNFSEQSLSQLLWATRGRTPHYYKSEPWGMTIPTNRGEQNITSIYVISNSQIHQYINWSSNRPTHTLKVIENISRESRDRIAGLFPNMEYCFILARNEDSERTYWEIGYQLLNIFLQAKALDISYRAILLNEHQTKTIQTAGINNPVAAVSI